MPRRIGAEANEPGNLSNGGEPLLREQAGQPASLQTGNGAGARRKGEAEGMKMEQHHCQPMRLQLPGRQMTPSLSVIGICDRLEGFQGEGKRFNLKARGSPARRDARPVPCS
jgi:hypothetical protein